MLGPIVDPAAARQQLPVSAFPSGLPSANLYTRSQAPPGDPLGLATLGLCAVCPLCLPCVFVPPSSPATALTFTYPQAFGLTYAELWKVFKKTLFEKKKVFKTPPFEEKFS